VLRFLAACVFAAASTVACGAPAIAFGLARRLAAARTFTRAWGRGILWVAGVRVEVQGEENVPAGAAVYAANHASALDIPLLFAHLPVDFRIIHKRSLYAVPVIGLYLRVGGHVPVERGRAFQSRRSLEQAAERIRGGTSVVVFPEGTRSRTVGVAPFKRGSFLIAVEAGVPVVPVSLVGVRAILPGGPVVRPGRVKIVVHPPLPTTGTGPEKASELAERVRRIVAAACEAA
jgi:1-acyl-sn-glycerol-3-phosphate acyltransferase